MEIGQSVAKARAATETRNETMNGGGFIGKSLLCSVHEFRHLAVAVGEFLLLDAHAMQQGEVKIGEPLHEMLLRVTIDDSFTIHDVIAATDNSPFAMCPDITPNYKSLVGIQMGAGWRKAIRQKVGGVHGCTHLTELLFPMATVAMQTIWPLLRHRKNKVDSAVEKSDRRPLVLDTCHAWSSDSPVVKVNAPQYYTGPETTDKTAV